MNLNELTLDNIGSWPVVARMSVIVFACLIIFTLFFVFDVRPLHREIAQAVMDESDLRANYEVKYSQIVSRGAYLEQVNTLESRIKSILSELPEELNVPELIGDISTVGKQAGLQFNYIKPQTEIKHLAYTALPVQISVNGTYKQLNSFISALAKIPRIVTISDFSIEHANLNRGAGFTFVPDANTATSNQSIDSMLTMELTAVTYKHNTKKTAPNLVRITQ